MNINDYIISTIKVTQRVCSNMYPVPTIPIPSSLFETFLSPELK